jgi:hypothetical protein
MKVPCKAGEVSDGHHTFDELYEHRHALFLALVKAHPEKSWISLKHHDGSEWDGWFIAGMDLPAGPITYHLPIRLWYMAMKTGAVVLERGKEWDGHTAGQVVIRLQCFVHAKEEDPFQSEDYQQFLVECAKHCRCDHELCDSVLAGGPCEERIRDVPDEDDED